MKNTIIGMLFLVFLASTAYAGPAGKGNGQGVRSAAYSPRMVHMQESLGLSQEQMEQIRSIRENGGGREEIRSVMTNEQRAMLDAHRASRQGRGPGDGSGGGPGNWPRQGYGNNPDNGPEDPGNG